MRIPDPDYMEFALSLCGTRRLRWDLLGLTSVHIAQRRPSGADHPSDGTAAPTARRPAARATRRPGAAVRGRVHLPVRRADEGRPRRHRAAGPVLLGREPARPRDARARHARPAADPPWRGDGVAAVAGRDARDLQLARAHRVLPALAAGLPGLIQ